MQAELSLVEVRDGTQILALGGIESLNGLQRLNGQALGFVDPLAVQAVAALCRDYGLAGVVDLLTPRIDLGFGFNDFSRDAIHRLHVSESCLVDAGRRFRTRGPFTEA